MDNREIASIAAYIGMTLSASASLPQLTRLVRTGDLAGLSSMTWTLSSCSFMAWVAYGFTLPMFAHVPGNLVSAVLSTAILTVMIRRGTRPARILALAGVIAGAGVAAFALIGPPALGWLAYATGAVRSLPQLVTASRSPSTAGLSASTWMLSGSSGVFWMVYAYLSGDHPVIAASTTGLITGVWVAVLARRGRTGLAYDPSS